MKSCFIILILVAILVPLILLASSHRLESYGRPGIMSPPEIDLPIPPNIGKQFGNNTYIGYSEDHLKRVCPTPRGVVKWCRTKADCGPAELCMNSAGYPAYPGDSQSESNYCVCSISNSCMEEGIC